MANLPRYPDSSDHLDPKPDRPPSASTPKRIYLIWMVVIALFLLMVILHLTGIVSAGSHGL